MRGSTGNLTLPYPLKQPSKEKILRQDQSVSGEQYHPRDSRQYQHLSLSLKSHYYLSNPHTKDIKHLFSHSSLLRAQSKGGGLLDGGNEVEVMMKCRSPTIESTWFTSLEGLLWRRQWLIWAASRSVVGSRWWV